ncbi:MAG: hypothetical protein KKC75_08160 [Nanoarchaeota archaeon]|nr:hypothetical protein [Nanoarchaeota archaeon]MBU1946962.1 hypothetical protein [Nanoarchaeota archaeon]
MAALVDMKDKIKKYYKFNPSELRGFIISILILSFIISFKEWGGDKFSLAAGFFNWFNAALIVTLAFIVYTTAQRIAGLSIGYQVEHKMWTTGLLIGLLFVFVSKGRIWLLLPGGIIIHHLAGHRLGYFRYDLGYFAHGMIAISGTIALITLAAIFKILNTFIYSPLLEKAILFTILFAIYDVLPIPPLSGSRLFFGSRMVYIFLFSTIIVSGLLLLSDINVMVAIVGSIIIGIVCWLLYYIFFEQKAWRGPWPKKWLSSSVKKK